MVKPDIIFCACPENKMSQKSGKISPIIRKKTEATSCTCRIGNQTKKLKLKKFENMKVVVDGVEVL